MTVRNMLLIAAFSFSVLASAQESSVLSLGSEMHRGDIHQPQGVWPFLGIGMGLMDEGDNVRTGGVPSHFKMLGSYYFEQAPWIADVGLGLHNHVLTQEGEGDDTIQSLYTELAARYQFTDRWQLGAIWNTLVDNPDRYRSNTENLASFFGVQMMKEFTWKEEYIVRAGGRAMTDIGISGDTVDFVMAELEVSFGSPRPRVAAVRPVEIRSEPIAPHLATNAMETLVLKPGAMNFESDSTQLVKQSNVYMRRLARALATNRQLFESVTVIGHTDQRGADDYNNRLSMRRATAIANTFITAGISPNQVQTTGRGKSEPLESSLTAGAFSRNRRVQIEFNGVTNQAALKNVIDSVPR